MIFMKSFVKSDREEAFYEEKPVKLSIDRPAQTVNPIQFGSYRREEPARCKMSGWVTSQEYKKSANRT